MSEGSGLELSCVDVGYPASRSPSWPKLTVIVIVLGNEVTLPQSIADHYDTMLLAGAGVLAWDLMRNQLRRAARWIVRHLPRKVIIDRSGPRPRFAAQW